MTATGLKRRAVAGVRVDADRAIRVLTAAMGVLRGQVAEMQGFGRAFATLRPSPSGRRSAAASPPPTRREWERMLAGLDGMAEQARVMRMARRAEQARKARKSR